MTGDKLRSIHIGIRSVKTAIAATLCALIYLPLGRNPAFACIGAVFGTGSDMAGSKLHPSLLPNHTWCSPYNYL